MPKTVFIVGQTAAGKTAAAIQLAESCGGEIVGADAYQVYSGLDLLTAKPTYEELAGVPHHLIGTVALHETYNVARFRAEALSCLAGIHARGRQAIVTGGSGMYVKALTHGLSPLPPANLELRAGLEALETPALLARLRLLDPVYAGQIDANNRRRLVRAVEVCLTTGQPFSEQRSGWTSGTAAPAPVGWFLYRDRDDLHARIEARVESIFAAGVLDEVRSLSATPLSATATRIIGWADIRLHLAGELSLAACKERLKAATRQYAKRQMTWFKREQVFAQVNLSRESSFSPKI